MFLPQNDEDGVKADSKKSKLDEKSSHKSSSKEWVHSAFISQILELKSNINLGELSVNALFKYFFIIILNLNQMFINFWARNRKIFAFKQLKCPSKKVLVNGHHVLTMCIPFVQKRLAKVHISWCKNAPMCNILFYFCIPDHMYLQIVLNPK